MAQPPIQDNEPLSTALPAIVPASGAATESPESAENFCKSLPPSLAQARRAFQRDLPRLLRECPRHWVAYSGERQIAAPDQSKTTLFQRCIQVGFKPGEFLLLAVSAESGSFLTDVDV